MRVGFQRFLLFILTQLHLAVFGLFLGHPFQGFGGSFVVLDGVIYQHIHMPPRFVGFHDALHAERLSVLLHQFLQINAVPLLKGCPAALAMSR